MELAQSLQPLLLAVQLRCLLLKIWSVLLGWLFSVAVLQFGLIVHFSCYVAKGGLMGLLLDSLHKIFASLLQAVVLLLPSLMLTHALDDFKFALLLGLPLSLFSYSGKLVHVINDTVINATEPI